MPSPPRLAGEYGSMWFTWRANRTHLCLEPAPDARFGSRWFAWRANQTRFGLEPAPNGAFGSRWFAWRANRTHFGLEPAPTAHSGRVGSPGEPTGRIWVPAVRSSARLGAMPVGSPANSGQPTVPPASRMVVRRERPSAQINDTPQRPLPRPPVVLRRDRNVCRAASWPPDRPPAPSSPRRGAIERLARRAGAPNRHERKAGINLTTIVVAVIGAVIVVVGYNAIRGRPRTGRGPI